MVNKKYTNSIFIFRRDLRLEDNTGLINSLKESNYVLPIFIFTKEQVIKNEYKSDHCVKFMTQSLSDLDTSLQKIKSKLNYFFGDNITCLKTILKNMKIDAIYVNKDYTPYSIERDKKIEDLCKKNKIDFNSYEDILLNPVMSILNGQGTIFVKFTPYFNKANKIAVNKSKTNTFKNYCNYIKKSNLKDHIYYKNLKDDAIIGGRTIALNILNNIKTFKTYNKNRNDLSYETTNLSAYIKFGCVSIREVYWAFVDTLGKSNDLIKQLYWRDFYYNIAFVNPFVFSKNGALKSKYNKIKWDNNLQKFDAWCNGITGFPIIDSAMTQMNKTGFMHNRARLIVASFLVKVLLIDWKWGEKYFAQKLVDYDPCVNNGNWQWISGSGADAQPYFRIFNPWSQAKNHDPDCVYIKTWLPKLKNVDNKHILEWDIYYKDYTNLHPKPIIDYSEEKDKALTAYKKIYA